MKIKLTLLSFVFVMFWQSIAMADQDAQLSAVAEMGRLNGIALQCRYLEQVQRIKQKLVENLPKQRALGEQFEQKTNASFMAFMKTGASCPGMIEFDKDLDKAVAKLETVFKK